MAARTLARFLTDVLNPFAIFTVLFFAVALAESQVSGALLYTGAELLAPALFLLTAFVVLLGALWGLGAPEDLSLLTLSMGLASATVALLTLFVKASAHCTVAGHAAAAGLLLLGPLGVVFLLVLPLVIWARVTLGAHTFLEALAGAVVGIGLAVLFLL